MFFFALFASPTIVHTSQGCDNHPDTILASMSLLKYSPKLSLEEARAFARDIYGVDARASALPSERDQNFLLKDQTGEKYVLKIANALEDRVLIEAQQQAMARVNERARLCQRVTPTRSGDLLTEIRSSSGTTHFIWMVTWLPGATLGESGWH